MAVMKRLLKPILVALFGALMLSCSNSTKPSAATGEDPVQQEIVQRAKKVAPKEVPEGYTMNSGGELVKISDGEDSDSDQ
jgi:hypothetical protein